MSLRAILTALFLAALAARAGAAVVTLKDGGILLGNVVGQTSTGVELATPEGTLHIDVDRISRIDYDMPSAARAAPRASKAETRQLLSLGAGLIQPVGHVDFKSIGGGTADNGDLGLQFGAEYLYYLTPRLGAGLDVDYFDRSGTLSEGLFPAASSSVNGDTWLMLGILRWSFAERGRYRPFVLAGAGGARNSETVDVRPSNWADTNTHETRRLIDDSAWAPAASARIGFDVDVGDVSPGGLITFEAGWTGVASERYAATPRGQAQGLSGISGPLNILAFAARYGWRF